MVELRQLKKDRTRAALVDAAMRLFAERGYEATTIADIAAAAEVGTRTFFRYFASKDEVLFPDGERRVQAALEAIAGRHTDERPGAVLVRALDLAGLTGSAPEDGVDPLRLQIIHSVPTAAGYALRLQRDAQRRISRALQEAFPSSLDEIGAAAIVGAFVGAFTGATAAAAESGLTAGARRLAVAEAVAATLSTDLRPQVALLGL